MKTLLAGRGGETMKTTIMTLSALAVLVGLASCSKEEKNSPSINTDSVKVSLFAEQENGSTRAKIGTSNGSETTILWSENDSLSVFDGDNKNIKFDLTKGAGETSGTFEGTVSKTSDSYIALYPYQETAAINTERGTISSVVLKSTQTATDGSFDPTAALMTAKESDGTLAFKNVVGYVKVTPKFNCKRISLVSNTEEKLAGTVSISIASDGTPTAAIASNASNIVSIKGDIKSGTTYYIAVIPATMSKGLKLIFTDSDGNESYRGSSNSLEIKRNTVTNLGEITEGVLTKLTNIPYLTFSASGNQTFTMRLPSTSKGEIGTFEYSVGEGEWTKVNTGTSVTFGGTGKNLRLRGLSSTGTAVEYNTNSDYYSQIIFDSYSNPVAASGDIRTLVDWISYESADMSNVIFNCLFRGCSKLTSAPDLPTTTLAPHCYYSMFYGCTSLTSAPNLPATKLAENCYENMFYGCSSLEKAPKLYATELAQYCCNFMFSGCTNLETIPENMLPATILASRCYQNMFNGCTNLKTIPEDMLPATTLASYCYSNMFYGCTNLKTIPEDMLPATTLASYCYYSMFNSCTALETAPELPATKLVSNCYFMMFYNCTSLNKVVLRATEFPDGTNKSNQTATFYWLYNAGTAAGDHILYTDLDLTENAENGYPTGWTKKSLSDLTE